MYFIFLLLSSLFHIANSHPTCGQVRTIYQYPTNNTFIENLAVRRDGSILFTSVANPGGIHSLNPISTSSPKLIGLPTGYNATLGIIEGKPDVFYFIAQNYNVALGTASFGTVPGSNSIWKLDFTTSASSPKLELLTTLPEAQSLNGLTKFNDTLLLAGDCKFGAVWAVNTDSKEHKLLVQDPLMAPPVHVGFQEGINGLRFVRDWWEHTGAGRLFFINTQTFSFAVLNLDRNAHPIGNATFLASAASEDGVKTILWDDFAVDQSGAAWIATENGNSIQRVRRGRGGWTAEVVAGTLNSTEIAEPTSAAFGRTQQDQRTLYVTSGGGFAMPIVVNGSRVAVGAQVLAVDVAACSSW